MRLLVLAVLLAGSSGAAQTEARLAHIFQDNMVLQREKPVPVWGWAAPDTPVEVGFGGQRKQGRANEQGYWKVLLDPLTASREGRVLEIRIGTNVINRKNVLVGEVWLAAGQSNMVAGGDDADSGVYPHYASPGTQGGKPEIRFMSFGFGASLEPLEDIDPAARGDKPWVPFKEDPPMKSGAIPHYFSRVVRDALDVPVGIIQVAVVGTTLAAWMAREALEQAPEQGRNPKTGGQDVPAAMKGAEAEWRKTGKGTWPRDFVNHPSALYNTRIHPLAPLALRGVIWHQGEAGASGDGLVAMVRQWRTLFGQDFDFVWGTLSRTTTESPPLAPLRSSFYRSSTSGRLRQALKLFGTDRHVALVELYDLGNDNTHFTMKAEAGRRMGLAALTMAYGQNQIYTGPRMVESKIEGGKATVRFEHVGNGLAFQPSIDGISGVYLRGKSGTVRWGRVQIIDKATAEFSHPDIVDLETVAYAANPNPHETLFNSAGLPASPFSVDPGRTRDADPAIHLVSKLGEKTAANLHVCHVRRSGYVFKLRPEGRDSRPGPVTVQAYIPAEWKGFEVETDGKPVAFKEAPKDGVRFITFQAEVDKGWITVAETGKAADFRKVNRF